MRSPSRKSLFTKHSQKLEQLRNTRATIEEATINPTNEQAQACLRVCQWLSNCYKDIHLFRFDAQTGDVYILAGDELEIIVLPNGLWDFL